MTQRFFSPNQQFYNDTGSPYAGGFLYFYASGTSTPQATYSNSGLTIANTNPVVLDSAGRAGNVFLQNLSYKVVLTDSNNVQVWTADPVWSSDYSTIAQFAVWNGNPNGLVAGTAGTQGGLPSSVIWDSTNDILYVATTTGTSTTTVWTAVNSPVTNPVVPSPAGRLTPTSGSPIINTDAISVTSVFWTPYQGSTVPVYNGVTFASIAYTELTLSLTASQAASTLYDVFFFNNSGTATIATGPAWTTSTAGSGARGSGASTTQLTLLNGIWVNAVQITARNGANTYTISANLATYLGTIFIDTTPGQVTCHVAYGQSRKFGVWNAYNRNLIYLQAGDATASWTYASATVRPANNSTANSLTTLCGLPEEAIVIHRAQNGSVAGTFSIGIGLNSTTVFATGSRVGLVSSTGIFAPDSLLELPPGIGINTITSLESATNSTTFTGGAASMVMPAQWMG